MKRVFLWILPVLLLISITDVVMADDVQNINSTMQVSDEPRVFENSLTDNSNTSEDPGSELPAELQPLIEEVAYGIAWIVWIAVIAILVIIALFIYNVLFKIL